VWGHEYGGGRNGNANDQKRKKEFFTEHQSRNEEKAGKGGAKIMLQRTQGLGKEGGVVGGGGKPRIENGKTGE